MLLTRFRILPKSFLKELGFHRIMVNSKLESKLRPIVREYGLSSVLGTLGEIASSDTQSVTLLNGNGIEKPKKTRAKPTATEYVAKMELPAEKRQFAAALAERFERRDFLPSFGDIAHFCQNYGIAVPASKTRASAIPRVFKFIANMETEEAKRMLDSGMFSGPSRLGPIADAIRNYGRAARESHTPASARASSSSRRTAAGDSASA